MRVAKGVAQRPIRPLFDLGPPAVERLGLEPKPGAALVSSYVPTRAAELAFRAFNAHSAEPRGGVFWVSGPPGSGKTHFLNYVIALESRAGAPERARHMTFNLEVAGQVRGAEMEAYVLEALAGQLSGDNRAIMIWREMRGAGALRVAFEQARRMGIGAITGAIDFGSADSRESADYFATLAETVAATKHLRCTIVGASRESAPPGAIALEVTPADPDEVLLVAVNRARVLRDRGRECAPELYQGVDLGGWDPAAIFPFHPATLRAMQALAYPAGTVAEIAAMAREALVIASDACAGFFTRPIYPSDLFASPGVMRRLEARLGESGMTALRAAQQALVGLAGNEYELGVEMVNTLVLDHVFGRRSALDVGELQARVPILAAGAGEAWTGPVVLQLMRKLSARSNGVVALEASGACFDPGAAGIPEAATFNAALALARKFAPSLTPARDAAQAQARLARLGEAMVDAVEAAGRTREVLAAALAAVGLEPSAEQQKALADYCALAEAGAAALLETAADLARRQAAFGIVSAYETLARAAAVVPRMRAMREYLAATGLRMAYEQDSAQDPRVAALETECQLLAAELTPRLLVSPPPNLDALEARFQKFKWTYVESYRLAHGQWRAEMERLAMMADDLRARLDALSRLNAIATLGPPVGEELTGAAAEHTRGIVRCEFDGVLQTEIVPRCPSCNYRLGTKAPRAKLSDLMERTRQALVVKLAALSQSAIARIIREHDHGHRLEGFLKITEAANTDGLVRVLDEKLARYLARLLDENLGSAGAHARAVVQPLNQARLWSHHGEFRGRRRSPRPVKIPPPHDDKQS